MFNMLNKFLIIFFIISQTEALADARPVTYDITMDYNTVTGQFENAKIIGGTARLNASGYWPIQITMEKDGITGLTPSEAGGGNQQIALQRSYTDFNFTLVHQYEPGLTIPIRAYLDTSSLRLPFRGHFESRAFNHNCTVRSNYSGITISAVNGSGCNALSYDYEPENARQPIQDTSMIFNFDLFDNIRTYLNRTNYKAGNYTGSITYTGDSIVSRVNGRMTESYTFNFNITKKKQLTGFIFPKGTNANFLVTRYGEQYIGTSELIFNVEGVFNSSDKLRFTFNSANSHNNKLSLKHATTDKFIPYKIELLDLKIGRPTAFVNQNESKLISNSSENIFNGKFTFSFNVNSDSVDIGNYSDRLTIIAYLSI
ncbi:hypothetical protein [Photobacterium damselae]|uniref:hypothetical protein n=1 Tax=Photobacterium damselae TaxID=38293 RepID=UPI000D6636C0|nr:hypothetical protein [Photobacterium damselae]AWK84044.1 hypothetical protein BST98_18845 [Photobacterium damselae]